MEKLTYYQDGDLYLPNLAEPQTMEEPLGKYAVKRRDFLRVEHPLMYQDLVMSGELLNHLRHIERMANSRLKTIMLQKEEQNPPPDRNSDPMAWAKYMSSIKAEAEESIYEQMIFV